MYDYPLLKSFERIKKNMTMNSVLKVIQSKLWPIPIFLISLVNICDIRYFTSPPLHSDDWLLVVLEYISGPQLLINFADRRPFGKLFSLLTTIFGLNIRLFYVLNFIVLFLTGIVLYQILIKAFPKHHWLSMPVVLIYLIYPLDFSKTWLTMLNGHFVLLINLLIIFLLLSFTQSAKVWQIILANLLFLSILLFYEMGFGIVVLSSLMLGLSIRHTFKKRMVGLSSILGSAAIFVLWRLIIQPNLFVVRDGYFEQMDLSITKIFIRYGQAAFLAVFSWVEPFLPSLGRQAYYLTFGFALLMIALLIMFIPRLIRLDKNNKINSWKFRKNTHKSLILITKIGVLFWAAGYIPVISFSSPNLSGNFSRVNLFAIPGVSLALVSGIALLMSFIDKNFSQIKILTLIIVVPFLIIGVVYQVWSHNERFKTWEDQKQIWNGMFELMPGLKDNTKIVIILSDYAGLDQFQILPFTWRWNARDAVRVLYNNHNLNAYYYYYGRTQSSADNLPEESDWSDYLFLLFDSNNKSVTLLDYPETYLPNIIPLTGYAPNNLITEHQPGSDIYRWLVKSTPHRLISWQAE